MGEKIKDLKKIKLGHNDLVLELNEGTHVMGKYDIHLQNDRFRLNTNEYDFLKIASCLMYAKENILYYKGDDTFE